MSLDVLAPDQRAVVELVLRQGRSYDELSGLLGISAAAVRDRALRGVDRLAGLSDEERGDIADYLLGQQSVSERERTRTLLAGNDVARAWAGVVAARLRDIAREPLPDVPGAAAPSTPVAELAVVGAGVAAPGHPAGETPARGTGSADGGSTSEETAAGGSGSDGAAAVDDGTPGEAAGAAPSRARRMQIAVTEDWLLDTPADPIAGGFWPRLRIALRPMRSKPWAMPYYRLALAILLVNFAILVVNLAQADWRLADGSALKALSALTLVNLTIAVLIRNPFVLNGLFAMAGRGRASWPMWLRWAISKVHHVGGIHVGAAVSGTLWLLAFAVVSIVARIEEPATVTLTTVVLVNAIAVLGLIVVLGALPPVRAAAHNLFENTHRFGGWTAVGLFWPLIIHVAVVTRGDESVASAILTDWHVWVLALATLSIASPWFWLKKVPVQVERPSKHAAIVTFDYGVTPGISSAIGVSLNPLREWHAFATVTTPGKPGFRILISRAGDWTSRFIDDPPTHVWVRGKPVSAPMAKTALLHKRLVFVVTGSGIGPCLGQILAQSVDSQLVWSTRSPRETYGDALVDEVLSVQPDAIIWDTTRQGKPDFMKLVRRAYHEFDAEAVFIVSNKPATFRLVEALERDGYPAFGPIWDS